MSIWVMLGAAVAASVWHPFGREPGSSASASGMRLLMTLALLAVFLFIVPNLFERGDRSGTDSCPDFGELRTRRLPSRRRWLTTKSGRESQRQPTKHLSGAWQHDRRARRRECSLTGLTPGRPSRLRVETVLVSALMSSAGSQVALRDW
jgi:hypothetical protein